MVRWAERKSQQNRWTKQVLVQTGVICVFFFVDSRDNTQQTKLDHKNVCYKMNSEWNVRLL
jgi:hypothetical protein